MNDETVTIEEERVKRQFLSVGFGVLNDGKMGVILLPFDPEVEREGLGAHYGISDTLLAASAPHIEGTKVFSLKATKVNSAGFVYSGDMVGNRLLLNTFVPVRWWRNQTEANTLRSYWSTWLANEESKKKALAASKERWVESLEPARRAYSAAVGTHRNMILAEAVRYITGSKR